MDFSHLSRKKPAFSLEFAAQINIQQSVYPFEILILGRVKNGSDTADRFEIRILFPVIPEVIVSQAAEEMPQTLVRHFPKVFDQLSVQ